MKKVLAFIICFSVLLNSSSNIVCAEMGNSYNQSAISSELTKEQRNSIAMLNYITVLTQEINASSSSKLLMEKYYNELINNTAPSAVDETTQDQIHDLLNKIETYRMIAVKRERLDYIYEYNKAQAIRNAVPNPLGLIGAVQSFDWKKLVLSVAYMAVDSVTSYKSAMAEADLEYLQENWNLDDQAAANLHNCRLNAYDYMIDVVQDNDLPDDLVLSEKNVNNFVKWENEDDLDSKIVFFESNERTYQNFGYYWIVLSQCYYEKDNYKKCIDCIEKYEEIQPKIFRLDHNLASALPAAICSARKIFSPNKFVEYADTYCSKLLQNTAKDDSSDWALRYFVAQTYIDLYDRTNKKQYLKEAYNIVRDNVNFLVEEQNQNNKTFLSKIVKHKIPKNTPKDKKKDIEQYNKMLEKQRKTELPPVYEPLRLNCELLFSLADLLNISKSEKEKVGSIMNRNSDTVFLTTPLENLYSFKAPKEIDKNIEFSKGLTETTLKIPASLLTNESEIKVTVTHNNTVTEFADWTIKEVNRKKDNDISTFSAVYKSKKAHDFDYSGDSKLIVEIQPMKNSQCEPITIQYQIISSSVGPITNLKFEKVN